MEGRLALELLGLDPDEPITYDRVRRAYLRKLRVYSPERDPDGFRRLREAYEELEPIARWSDHAAAHEESLSDPVATSMPGRDGALAWILECGTTTSDPQGAAPTTMPDATGPIDALAASAPDTTDPVDAQPASARDTTDSVDEPAEPAPDTTGPVDEPIATAEPIMRDPLDPVGGQQSLAAVTDEILELFQSDEIHRAQALADRWNRSAQDDHREVTSFIARRWALTRELLDVAPLLPLSLRRTIAHGIATDDLTDASRAARRFRMQKPERARDLDEQLARRASSLHSALRQALRTPVDAPASQPEGSTRGRFRIAIFVAIALSAAMRSTSSCNDHRSRDPAPTEIRVPDRVQRLLRDHPELGLDPNRTRFERDRDGQIRIVPARNRDGRIHLVPPSDPQPSQP